MSKFTINILDKKFDVDFKRLNDSHFLVTLGGKKYEAQILDMTKEEVYLAVDQNLYTVELGDMQENGEIRSQVNQRERVLTSNSAMATNKRTVPLPDTPQIATFEPKEEEKTPPEQTKEDKAPILAPMPGKVVMLTVSVGDTVEVGDVVLILEAMKMENEITSDRDGKVVEVRVKEGDSVDAHDVLVMVG